MTTHNNRVLAVALACAVLTLAVASWLVTRAQVQQAAASTRPLDTTSTGSDEASDDEQNDEQADDEGLDEVVPVPLQALGLQLSYPSTWQLNAEVLSLGGPISLNNFNGAYAHGGIRPADGAEIDIALGNIPQIPLSDFIGKELQGTNIESMSPTTVGDAPGTKVVYTVQSESSAERTIAVFVPHGQFLYKFFLSYRDGLPGAAELAATLEQIMNSVQFAP